MKMSCHIFQPLKQRLFLGEVVLTALSCSAQAAHRAGYVSAGGEEEGGYSGATHMQGSWLGAQVSGEHEALVGYRSQGTVKSPHF